MIISNFKILLKGVCIELGVECVEKVSHTLWDPKDIIKANSGAPPFTYDMFMVIQIQYI